MQTRENVLHTWIKSILGDKAYSLSPLAGDASFRRYYRIEYANRNQVIMDAPPEKESVESFIHIAKVLKNSGIHAPRIHAVDIEKGFILLDDLGDRLFGQALLPETPEIHYNAALSVLLQMQNCPIDDHLPPFDLPFMLKEMALFQEWFLKAYLHLDLTPEEEHLILNTQKHLATRLAEQPQVFIHRDYHSRNLMVIGEEQPPVLGVLDFQDAMHGPITYDLVSILKDCYIRWPREKILAWVQNFYLDNSRLKDFNWEDFVKAFDLCGLQRHLKVLGIFSRLYLRDNKAAYLKDLPLTLNYVLECTEYYEELQPLYAFLQKRVRLP